jgi:molecular chaperone GrpE
LTKRTNAKAQNHPGQLESDIDEAHSEATNSAEQANADALMDTLKSISEERDKAKEQLLRAMADHQNYRRRTQEQMDQAKKLATENLVRNLLPVLDNFERTVGALDIGASTESVLEGVRGVEKQLRSALESVQLQRIEAVGKPFDPEVHEAVAMHEDNELPANTVTHELEPGYTMSGKVIRPAKVRVSKPE